jgi:hypothetical protein
MGRVSEKLNLFRHWRRRRALRRRFARLINARRPEKARPVGKEDETQDIARVLERWHASLSDGLKH